MNCATCRKELEQGMDVFQLEEGIVGIQGIVPLNSAVLFCSVECLKDFFNGKHGYVHMPRRIA